MTVQALASKAMTSRQLTAYLLEQIADLVCVADADYNCSFLNAPSPGSPFSRRTDIRCYESLLGTHRPCAFCPLSTFNTKGAASIRRVIKRGNTDYQIHISPLICDDGLPLCLHVIRPLITEQPCQRRNRHSVYDPTSPVQLDALLGQSPPWCQVKDWIQTLAAYPTVTILLEGETGTGKELVAQALHSATYGSQAPFVPLTCAALPEHLLESELFGYERGAFTGANQAKPGLLELAHGGTLFLDEIEDLTPAVQAKLLRVLETKRLLRLGGTRPVEVEWRLCCATNTPLQTLVAAGTFRSDLLYRLSGFTLTLPPLRQRLDDIPLLADAFLSQANYRFGKQIQGFTPDALAALQAYGWPGNVRELYHVIDRAVILTDTNGWIERTAFSSQLVTDQHPDDTSLVVPLREIEQRYIVQILSQCGGNQSQAATRLGISRTTLRKKLRDTAQV